MVTVIRNGTIVTATSEYISDVKIENGIISEIGSIGDIVGAEVVNASGSFLFPGFVDPHTHVDMGTGDRRTADDFASGSAAAIAGGTTTLIDFITQHKGGTLSDALAEWHQKAKGTSFCDYGFHMGIIDWNDYVQDEMATMVQEGVPSFKMYMAYKNTLQVSDDVIYQALTTAGAIGGLMGFHCENGDIIEARTRELLAQGKTSPYYHQVARTETVETEAIYRITQLAKLTQAPIWIVHLSTAKGLEIIKAMRNEGVDILAETCPQYLVLDNTCYGTSTDNSFEGAKFVMSPPPRAKRNQQPLWEGLQQGEIQMVSSDHCPYHYKHQKELGRSDFSQIPNGAPGVEHRLPLLYTYGVKAGNISLPQMVAVGATNPAKELGLTAKGSIEVGKDADIVLFSPKGQRTISAATQHQRVDYTPYENMEVQGTIQQVMLRGRTVYKDGKLRGAPSGVFQHRAPYTT